MDIRPISYKKYNITKNKFREMYYFCLQYHEWKDELKYKTDTLKSQIITDMPQGTTKTNATESLVIKREELIRKCELVEQTAIEADPAIYQYIIKSVTNYNITYNYLKYTMAIPCGKDMFYDRRRRFYWLLSQKKI